MFSEITKLFLTEQYTSEIVSTLTNKEIDSYLDYGVRLLLDAKKILESGEYKEYGLTRSQVVLDIAKIEYNLDKFTEAFLIKERMMVLTKFEEPMFFHMN